MSGDQIYADDVAGPMLVAIHASSGDWDCSNASRARGRRRREPVHASRYLLPTRTAMPAFKANENCERFFGGVRKPVFTTSNAHNHLITLGEVGHVPATWSPTPWSLIEVPPCSTTWRRSSTPRPAIAAFREDCPAPRVMAHLPILMIFDDHDVTDD